MSSRSELWKATGVSVVSYGPHRGCGKRLVWRRSSDVRWVTATSQQAVLLVKQLLGDGPCCDCTEGSSGRHGFAWVLLSAARGRLLWTKEVLLFGHRDEVS